MGAWEEMEDYESSRERSVSTVCWLGMFAFGVLGGVLTGFFAMIGGMGEGGGRISICFGAAFGIFASSSGGGDPCLFSSGGGPWGFLAIFASAFVGVFASDVVFPLKEASLISSGFVAAGVGVVVAGFASAAAMRIKEVRLTGRGGGGVERNGGKKRKTGGGK